MNVGQSLPFTNAAKQINCRDANADQVLEGWCELFDALQRDVWCDTALQKKFRSVIGDTAVAAAKSRVADSFLQRNLHLF